MSPRLLLLAAEFVGRAPGRGCNDYKLPADLSHYDVVDLCRLANLANFGDEAGVARARKERPGHVWTPKSLQRGTLDFIVIGALQRGLKELAEGGGVGRS